MTTTSWPLTGFLKHWKGQVKREEKRREKSSSQKFSEINFSSKKITQKITGDVHLLTTLLPILREKNHIREQIIDVSLSNFINNSSEERALETFELCFSKFCDPTNLIELRTAVIERLIVIFYFF